jgi:CubicO group peptidase (beta-lactamase class C family)
MQLRDRNLLSLDHAIIDYIPELKAVHNPYGDIRNITIRQLLSHSAGFRDPTWPWGGDKDWHPYEPIEWEQLVAMMPYSEILFKPGYKYSYSNLGIVFLGRIIELISGDDYEVYIDKNIFKPLEMYKSYFDHTPYHLLAHRSNNYYITNGKMITNGLDFNTGITVSNGGLNAPLGDMRKYLTYLIGNGDNYNSILNRSSLEEMWQIQHDVSSDSRLKESIALNFFVIQRGKLRVIGHTGEQKGFMSFFYIHPESRSGCLAVFNTIVNTFNAEEDLVEPNTIRLRSDLRFKILDEIFPIYLHNER